MKKEQVFSPVHRLKRALDEIIPGNQSHSQNEKPVMKTKTRNPMSPDLASYIMGTISPKCMQTPKQQIESNSIQV